MMRIFGFLILFFIGLAGCHDAGIDPVDPVVDPIVALKEKFEGSYSGIQIVQTLDVDSTGGYWVRDTTYIVTELKVRFCTDSTQFAFIYGAYVDCCFDEAAFESDSMKCEFHYGKYRNDFIMYPHAGRFKNYFVFNNPYNQIPPSTQVWQDMYKD